MGLGIDEDVAQVFRDRNAGRLEFKGCSIAATGKDRRCMTKDCGIVCYGCVLGSLSHGCQHGPGTGACGRTGPGLFKFVSLIRKAARLPSTLNPIGPWSKP